VWFVDTDASQIPLQEQVPTKELDGNATKLTLAGVWEVGRDMGLELLSYFLKFFTLALQAMCNNDSTGLSFRKACFK
jgi:hypothetical protein